MSDPKRPILPLIVFLAVLEPLALAGGFYLGATVFVDWLSLKKTEPSVFLLLKYWQANRLPETMFTPLLVSTILALILGFLPLIVVLLALILGKPKRELHGSARFANDMEIRQAGLLQSPQEQAKQKFPDILIGKHKGKYLRWFGNEFFELDAPTRSGKGVGIVIPNCLHYRDSMVVYDPKYENFLITAGFRQAHGQEVFLFNPAGKMPTSQDNPDPKLKELSPLMSHCWNPYTYIRRDARFTYKDLMNMAQILLASGHNDSGSTQFFTESARKLFVGLSLFLIETEHERDLNDFRQRTTLANLFRLTSPTDGRPLNEWLKDEIESRPHLSSQCQTLLLGFVNGSPKTGADILSSLTAPLGMFLDPVVEKATSADDFRLDELRKKRMTIYIGIVPTEMGTFRNLMNLFFNQLIDVNVQQGLPENNKSLKYQCLLLMDEFPALGKMSVIVNAVAFIAGYNLRLLIINQSPSQLEDIYGKEAARTLTTNFACRVLYTPRDQKDAQEYSEIIGYETFKSRSTSRSTGKGTSRSQSISDQKRAVMNPDEMKTMPASDCIVTLNKVRPIYAQKIIYWQDPVFTARLDKDKYPVPQIPELDLPIPQAVHQEKTSQNQSTNQIQSTQNAIRQPENPTPPKSELETAEPKQEKSQVNTGLDYEVPEHLKSRMVAVDTQRFRVANYEMGAHLLRYVAPDNPKTVLFEDKGKSIHTARDDKQTIQDMLDVAKAKGWDSIKISGSQEFKQQMWLEAESRGIATKGYKPSPEDLAILEQRRAERATNSIAEAEKLKQQSAVQERSDSSAKTIPTEAVKAADTVKAHATQAQQTTQSSDTAKAQYENKLATLPTDQQHKARFYERLALNALRHMPAEFHEKTRQAIYENQADLIHDGKYHAPDPMKSVERQPEKEKSHERASSRDDDWEMER